MRILAVDDEAAVLEAVREALAPAGCEIREARSGADALTNAHEIVPDLILLDTQLPDMTGLEVLLRLRATRWGVAVRVAVMDDGSGARDLARWSQAGCVGVIEKPFTAEALGREIPRWLSMPAPSRAGTGEAVTRRPERLGQILLANALITSEQLRKAIAAQQAGSGKRLGQLLVEQGAVTEDDIAWALSQQLLYPYIFITRDIIDDEVTKVLPERFLRERRVLPLHTFGGEITLAMADPTDQSTVDEVAAQTGFRVNRALALASNIEGMLERLFSRPEEGPAGRGTAVEAQYLHFHLVQALEQAATEIHLDPTLGGPPRVRYRLQGVLVDRGANPPELHAGILHHLRALTGLGPGATGAAPATVTVGEVEIRLVVTIVPTTAGVSATLTLYPYRTGTPDLVSLGVDGRSIQAVQEAIEGSRGVMIVGCTDPWLRATVLHGLLRDDRVGKTWALEELPVYRRPIVNQTVVRSPEQTAALLRDTSGGGADLIVVGDASGPAALLAVHEAGLARTVLAGHPQDDVVGLVTLVLAGAGGPLAGSALRGLVAARPVRLLCPECKVRLPQGSRAAGGRFTFAPRGCTACSFTGFRGRRLLTEMWLVGSDDRALLRSGSSRAVVARITRAVGSSMRRQGMGLVEDGLTSPHEVSRVVEGA